MAEPTNGAPAGVAQPLAAPPQGVAAAAPTQGPKRMRISDMQEGLEAHNAQLEARARQPEPREAPQDPRALQALPDAEPELPAPSAELDGDLEPELPVQQADLAAAQAKDQELLAATKAWLEGGETPDAIRNAIHEWTDKTTGAPRRMTIAQMEEGVLRQSDYQRNMNELRGYHQQVQFREQAAGRLEQAFQNPDQLFAELERRDPAVFHQVSVRYATQRAKMKQVAEAAGYALMQQYGYQSNHPDVVNAVRQTMQAQEHARRVEVENQRLQEHNQMLAQVRQQQDGQAQRQQHLGALRESITPLIPTAFKSVGVRNTATNQESFWKHLASHVQNLPGWDGNVRRAHCTAAAQAVREELEDLAHARAPKRPAQQSRAMSPTKLTANGTSQAQPNERKRISDMANDPRFNFGVG